MQRCYRLKTTIATKANLDNRPANEPPSLGLNLLMDLTTTEKMKNMMCNLDENRIRVIQGVLVLNN